MTLTNNSLITAAIWVSQSGTSPYVPIVTCSFPTVLLGSNCTFNMMFMYQII